MPEKYIDTNDWYFEQIRLLTQTRGFYFTNTAFAIIQSTTLN
jgi:hypothetical protein